MSADILEYVDQKVRDSASSSTEWSILYADDWAKIRAEIVRLRGEVCSCPSGDGSLRWPCKAHPPGAIAPAEAKDPAPAMPDGVEGLVAEWEALIAHPDTSTIMRTTLENVVTRLRAADNRDAAGVSDDDFVHPEYIRGFNDGAKHTPAAGPAGEAVAVADDFRGWYCAQCQRGVDGREVTFGEQHEVCGRYITDDRPPTPQPADGGAVAWQERFCINGVWGDWYGVSRDAHDEVARDKPAKYQVRALYTHPPAAQVQQDAAPQLVRYGRGSAESPYLLDQRDDGYWTPWHVAQRELTIATLAAQELANWKATHPAGDALGAVRELVAKWRAYGPEIGPSVGYMARKACANELEAALQHRGDSRGGEASDG